MALEREQSATRTRSALALLDEARGWVGARLASLLPAPADPEAGGTPSGNLLTRLVTSSLQRRILVSNFVGLIILLGGILYLSQNHQWLLDAKIDALRVQGEIIAKAIAAPARDGGRSEDFDPDRLPENEGSLAPFRDDGFAALELSLKPERVTPILRRLIGPTNTRARIYGVDQSLIADTSTLLSRGQIMHPIRTEETVKTKDFWTYLTYWMIDNSMPVYRDPEGGKLTDYPAIVKAQSGNPTPMLLLSKKGEQMAAMAVPIRRQNAVRGVLLLSTHPGDIDKIIWDERKVILILFALSLLASIVVSILLARTIAKPIRKLSHTAKEVSQNINFGQGLPDYSSREDEVGEMSRAFSAMTGALFKRIEASEKFAADVAHELKNPLTAARSTAESLGYAKTEEQRGQLVQQIQFELKRLNRLITDVSNASRLDAELARQKMHPIDVTTVLTSVADIFRDILSDEGRRIALIIEPQPYDGAYIVNGDEGRLGQVVTNLVDNALSFSPENGTVTLRLKAQGLKVDIVVDDEGPGIPDDRLRIIFDRFYSDRPETDQKRGKNSGLGLSISKEIVSAHNGEVWAENRTEAGKRLGARFVVRLPAARGAGATRGGSLIGRRG
jgi:two-component system sensor histidine kinase ChvG